MSSGKILVVDDEADIRGLRFDVDNKGHKTWLVDCVKE